MRLIVVLLGLCISLLAQTMLWKVSYAGKTLYLGGTIHMLSASDYPLPKAFDKAFHAADVLVLETDMGVMASPVTALKMQSALMYRDGRMLRDAIGMRTYAALKRYAQNSGVPMHVFDTMKPPMVAMTMMNVELQRLGMTAPGVDMHYFERAKRSGLKVAWFESVEQQIAIIAAMGKEDPDGMILDSLAEIGEYKSVFHTIVTAWRNGDTSTLYAFGKKYLLNASPKDYRRLIVERNRRWLRQLKPMLKSRETELVLVGSLHLVGPDGLIAQLKRKGYRVEQL